MDINKLRIIKYKLIRMSIIRLKRKILPLWSIKGSGNKGRIGLVSLMGSGSVIIGLLGRSVGCSKLCSTLWATVSSSITHSRTIRRGSIQNYRFRRQI